MTRREDPTQTQNGAAPEDSNHGPTVGEVFFGIPSDFKIEGLPFDDEAYGFTEDGNPSGFGANTSPFSGTR